MQTIRQCVETIQEEPKLKLFIICKSLITSSIAIESLIVVGLPDGNCRP